MDAGLPTVDAESQSTRKATRLLRGAAAAFTIGTVLHVIVLAFPGWLGATSWLPKVSRDVEAYHLWMGSFALLGAQLLVTVMAALAAKHARPTIIRRSWRFFFLASLPALCATLVRAGQSWAAGGILPPPSVANVPRLLSYPLYLLGLLCYPVAPQTWLARLKLALDVAFATIAISLVVIHVFFVPGVVSPAALVAWLYPLADIVLAVNLFALLSRARQPIALLSTASLSLSFGAAIVADVAYAHLTQRGVQVIPIWVEAAWLLARWYIAWAGLCIVYGAEAHLVSAKTQHRMKRAISGLGVILQAGLHMALIVIALRYFNLLLDDAKGMLLLASLAVLAVLEGARYALARTSNEQLYKALRAAGTKLKRRVEERTQQLAERVAEVQQLRAEAERRAAALKALQQATRDALRPLSLHERLQGMVHVLLDSLGYDGCWLGLLDQRTHQLVRLASAGPMLGSDTGNIKEFFPLDLEPPGSTVTAWKGGQPVLISDPAQDLRISAVGRKLAQEHGVSCMACVPIMLEKELLGAITVSRYATDACLDNLDVELLTAFAQQSALAIMHSRLYDEARQSVDEQAALLYTATLVTSSLGLDAVLSTVARQAGDLLRADSVTLYLYHAASDELELRAQFASRLSEEQMQAQKRMPLAANAAAAEVVRTKCPLFIADTSKDLRLPSALVKLGVTSSLLLPLLVKEKVLGLLILNRYRQPHPFTEHDADLALALAQHTSIAMEKARLYEELEARMEELARTQTDLLRSQRLQGLAQMVAGAAHELNNPLAVMQGYAELLLQQDLPEQAQADVQRLLEATQRCQRVVSDLVAFGQRKHGQRGPTDINKVLESTLSLCEFDLQASNVTVKRQLATDLPLMDGDASLLQQVFFNIILNAQQAMSEAHQGGTLTLRSVNQAWGTGNVVRVEISDDGPGVAPEIIDRIFDPFFTTRRPGQSTGLGLSVCFGIVQEHYGRIWAECPALQQYPDSPGQGLTIIVELPAMDTPP